MAISQVSFKPLGNRRLEIRAETRLDPPPPDLKTSSVALGWRNLNMATPPPTTAAPDEKTLWKGSPSQIINFGVYFLCISGLIIFGVLLIMIPQTAARMALGAGMAICLVVALLRYIATRCRVYEVTSQRIRTSTGVFSRRTDEFELYRVKDITLIEPFFLRISGAGNIVITTNDTTTPTLTLEAIREPQSLREQIRKFAEVCRERKGVRVTEME